MPNGLFTLKQQVLAIQEGAWPGGKTSSVDYLVVAGGGGGGGYYGAGGGGGGLLQGNVPVAVGSAITVTVGAGGTGTSNGYGNNGSSSVFGPISTTGGGGGAGGSTSSLKTGNAGGSGGGGQGFGVSGIASGGAAVSGQGNAGGAASGSGGGFGGGAGTVGLDSLTVSGRGGAGIASAISGTVTAYAGGGAGAGRADAFGGVGGGGNSNVAGAVNTGGGAGGDDAKSGGSGIVIISYPDVYAAPTATTGSPTVSTSGSGSIALSGTLQSLSTPSNSGLAFDTGDFTVEAWVYTNTLSGERGFFQTSTISSGFDTSYANGVSLLLGSSGNLVCQVGNTAISSGATVLATGTGYHVAVTRASGSVRLFLNGVLVSGPTTITTNLPGTFAAIGGYFNNNFLWNGNISNLRVVKGTAVYTSAFTPSTTPLTAISGTSLLLNTVSGAQLVDGSPNSLTLAPISGSTAPTWNQLSPFATGLGFKNRVYRWTSSGSITF